MKALRATFLLAALSGAFGATTERPSSITCPIDGLQLQYDHDVGMGDNKVCWYSHYGTDPQTGKSGKHEAYAACPD